MINGGQLRNDQLWSIDEWSIDELMNVNKVSLPLNLGLISPLVIIAPDRAIPEQNKEKEKQKMFIALSQFAQ